MKAQMQLMWRFMKQSRSNCVSKKLLSDMACQVQRFLMMLCLRKGGEGFITSERHHIIDYQIIILRQSDCFHGIDEKK